MSKSISVCDTHRLPYPNCALTAVKIGTTTAIKFYNSSNEDLGMTLHTNCAGYLCDGNGTLYTKGVFVHEDATVKATFQDGTSTNWDVLADSSVTVNDGKMLNKDGTEVWSANSADNYTMNYNDLANQPHINEWRESEQDVVFEQNNDTVVVDPYTKIMVLGDPDSKLSPQLYGLGMATLELQRGTWSDRWGQNFKVMNTTDKTIGLKNQGDPLPFVIVERGSYVIVSWLTDGTFSAYPRDPLVSVDSGVVGAMNNTASYVVTDSTPDMVRFTTPNNDIASIGTLPTINLSVSVTRTRKLFFKWVPTNWQLRQARVYVNSVLVAQINAQQVYEVICYPNGTLEFVYVEPFYSIYSVPGEKLSSAQSGTNYYLTAIVENSMMKEILIGDYGNAAVPDNTTQMFQVILKLPKEYNGRFRLHFGADMKMHGNPTNFQILVMVGSTTCTAIGYSTPGAFGTSTNIPTDNTGLDKKCIFDIEVTGNYSGSTPLFSVMRSAL